jgi:hypothetical protein
MRVFENRVLRIMFAPKRVEVTGGCRKLHDVELRNFYSSPNIMMMIKARRIKQAEHVARSLWER